jgi:hypothetical protein
MGCVNEREREEKRARRFTPPNEIKFCTRPNLTGSRGDVFAEERNGHEIKLFLFGLTIPLEARAKLIACVWSFRYEI